MTAPNWQLFMNYGFFVVMLFIAGLYCILVTRNLMRVLIGLELLTKGVTILLIVAGYMTGRVALAQAIVITLIVIEVVVMAVMAGVILNIYKHAGSLDASNIKTLRG